MERSIELHDEGCSYCIDLNRYSRALCVRFAEHLIINIILRGN